MRPCLETNNQKFPQMSTSNTELKKTVLSGDRKILKYCYIFYYTMIYNNRMNVIDIHHLCKHKLLFIEKV